MVIEESVLIRSPLDAVWQAFIDLTCWADWNTVLQEVSSPKNCIEEGGTFRCCVKPYRFPISFEPKVKEVLLHQRIVWEVEKFGIHSTHEFLFRSVEGKTEIISRETFSGIPVDVAGPLFPREKLRKMNADFLRDLREAAEGAPSADMP